MINSSEINLPARTYNLDQACVYCSVNQAVELDHFIPKSWGGTNDRENLVWACRSCNSSKSDYHPAQWYKAQSFYCDQRWKSILVETGFIECEIDLLQPALAPRYVDLSPYWTEDKKLSIQSAKDKTGLDKRTLSAAKKGQLDRGHFETLYKLRDLASELAGRPLTIEEIFRND